MEKIYTKNTAVALATHRNKERNPRCQHLAFASPWLRWWASHCTQLQNAYHYLRILTAAPTCNMYFQTVMVIIVQTSKSSLPDTAGMLSTTYCGGYTWNSSCTGWVSISVNSFSSRFGNWTCTRSHLWSMHSFKKFYRVWYPECSQFCNPFVAKCLGSYATSRIVT